MKQHTICLLNDSFPPVVDGVANAVVNYAGEIERSGGHSIVVTPEVPGADDRAFPFPVIRYPSIDTRSRIGYVTGYPFSPEAAYQLDTERAELLHVHCPIVSAMLARQLRESLNLPLVLTWHTKYDIDIANAVRSKLLQEGAIHALMWNVSACDEVWTVSRGAGENLRSLGFEGDYLVMPNGVDLSRGLASEKAVLEATQEFDLPEGVPVFLFVGRLMWYKGIRLILDALDEIKADGTDFRMVFVGGGQDAGEIQAYCRELGLEEKCFFAGMIGDRELLRAWYTRADLFLFPSTFDTNGLVVREAAACDLPSVLIAGSCAAEDVTDGQNAFLIEESAASLARKLRELLPHPEQIRSAGEAAGRELYLSWGEAVSRASERYDLIIDRFRRGQYPRKPSLERTFLESQGDLMDVMGHMEAAGKELRAEVLGQVAEARSELRAAREEAQAELRAAREETRAELRAAREEAQAELRAAREETRAELRAAREETRAELRAVRDEFLGRLDRYL